MSTVELSPKAQDDLVSLAGYLSDHSVTDALRFVDAAEQAIRRLSEWPWLGHTASELGDPSLRVLVIHRYFLVVHRHAEQRTLILRVVDGRADPESIRDVPRTEE